MYWPPVSFYTAVPSPPVSGIPTGCGGAAGCKRAGTAARNPTVRRCFYRNTGGILLSSGWQKGFHDGVVIGNAGRRKGLPDTELLQQFPEIIRGVLPALVAVKKQPAGASSPEKGGLKGPGHQGGVILAGGPGCQDLAGE